jgi:uncharacterized protein YjdB
MIRFINRILIVSMLFMLAEGAGMPAAGQPHRAYAAADHVYNGGFEEVTPGSANGFSGGLQADRWTAWGAEATVESAVYHSGSRSLKLLVTNATTAGAFQSNISVEPGKTYRVSEWVKTDSISASKPTFLRFTVSNSSGTALITNKVLENTKLSGTRDWTYVEDYITIPQNGVRLNVGQYFDYGTGTVWIDDVSVEEMEPTGVSLNVAAANLEIGNTLQLTATVVPANANNKNVVWSSSDVTVAAVADGRVTGLKAGTAVITAVTEAGSHSASALVTVVAEAVRVTGIAVYPASGTLTAGDSVSLQPVLTPADATNRTVIWSTSNGAIASVASGAVTGAGPGKAVITATTEDGGFSASYEVTVVPRNLIENGNFETVTAEAGGVWTELQAASWSAWGDGAVISVDRSVFHSGEGALKMSRSASGTAGVSQDSIPLKSGKSYKLGMRVKTEGISASRPPYIRMTFRNASWGTISSNVVLNNTKVSGTRDWTYAEQVISPPEGAAYVRLEEYFDYGTGTIWLDDISLTEYAPVTGITVNKQEAALAVGEALVLEAEVSPDNATIREIGWLSSSPDVASVDGSGLVTGLRAGAAKITAYSIDGGFKASCVVTVGATSVIPLQDVHAATDEDTSASGSLPAIDAEGNALSYMEVDSPLHGSLQLSASGSWTYTPDANYYGTDSFGYAASDGQGGIGFARVIIAVAPVNDLPVLADDARLTVLADWSSTVSGRISAQDPDGDGLTYAKSGDPVHGSVTVNADGSWEFTTAAEYSGYETFRIAISDGHGGTITPEVTVNTGPKSARILSDLKSHTGQNQHPRLMARADDFERMKSQVVTDPYMAKWYANVKKSAEAVLTEPPVQYKPDSGNRFLETSRLVLSRLQTLGLMYRITGESRYAERAWLELETVSGANPDQVNYNWPTWNASAYLDTAEMAAAVATGFDWIYDYLDEGQRAVIVSALKTRALDTGVGHYRNQTYFTLNKNNWNSVCNGGLALAALAVYDEPGLEALAGEVLEGGLKSLSRMLKEYAPDGAWGEGPAYWAYANSYLGYYLSSLETAAGTDYGLSQMPGIADTTNFPIYLVGPQGAFNFADSNPDYVRTSVMNYYAAKFNKPEYAWYLQYMTDLKGGGDAMMILYYRPEVGSVKPEEREKLFRNLEAIGMHSEITDPYGTFVGFKGGYNQMSHGDLDIGTFVFDALGVRWAGDLGMDNYDLPGFWDFGWDAGRWTYYRKRAEGHNTLVINPGLKPDQDPYARAEIIRSEAAPESVYAIADLSQAYSVNAISAQRGVKLFDNRQQFWVQDELMLKQPSDVWWFMNTPAAVELSEDGRTATLSRSGKRLSVKIASPQDAVFTVMDASPLPMTPNPPGQAVNTGKKLAIHLSGVTEETISVWMTPLLPVQEEPAEQPALVPLAQWSAVEQSAAALQGIEVGGAALESFNPDRHVYDVILPSGAAEAPAVNGITGDPGLGVAVMPAPSIPGIARIKVSSLDGSKAETVYYVNFKPTIAIGKPENAPQLTVAAFEASGYDGTTVPANTLDGNLATRWSAEGRQWIRYDLGAVQTVSKVALAWYNGNQRYFMFDIDLSEDGEHWTKMYSGASTGMTSDYEVYEFPDTKARYVRITGNGNSQNMFVSITETAIFGPDGDEDHPGSEQPGNQPSEGENPGDEEPDEEPDGEPDNGQEPGDHQPEEQPSDGQNPGDQQPDGDADSGQEPGDAVTAGPGDTGLADLSEALSAIGEVNGSKVYEFALDPQKTAKLLSDAAFTAREALIRLPSAKDARRISVTLPASLLQDVKAKLGQSAAIVIMGPLGGYRLPADAVPAGQTVTVRFEAADEQTVKVAAAGAKALAMRMIGEPVKFSVIATDSSGRSQSVDDFGRRYVSRYLPSVPGANTGTGGYLVRPDGALAPVPTYFDKQADGTFLPVIKRTGNSAYVLLEGSKSFADTQRHWAEKEVSGLASRLLIQGKAEGQFGPEAPVTRAEFAALLVRGLGLMEAEVPDGYNTFGDVAPSDWFAETARTAASYGLMEGEYGSFFPNRPITREEMAVILQRAVNFASPQLLAGKGAGARLDAFADAQAVSGWAREAAADCVAAGLLEGDSAGYLHPRAQATRAEAAVITARLLKKLQFMNEWQP